MNTGYMNETVTFVVKEDKTIEEVAKEMRNALNKVSKFTPRDAYIVELQSQIVSAIKNDEFHLSDSIAALTLCAIEHHNDWSLEGIKAFSKSITQYITMVEKIIDCAEHNGDITEALFDTLKKQE